jgi:predicted unusual protein kinase regulating ubiquinone biosynthesis (AarF/ABC1/UbiB family)/predicted transcriptional regulator
MEVSEIMRRDVLTVEPTTTLADAARSLRKHQTSALVVTEGSAPIGILTERDIVQSVVDGVDPATANVGSRMTTELLTVGVAADAEDATDLMAKHGIRHVPVVDGGQLVGIVSLQQALLLERRERRPASNFGQSGVVAHFRGPFSTGPPPAALEVETPAIDKFGFAELRRMVVIQLVLVLSVLRSLAAWLVRPRRASLVSAASNGLVDGFVRLGPTYVKLGQLIASSPGVFPKPLADAAIRCLDEVPPFPGEVAREMIHKDLGRPPQQLLRHFDDTPLSAASIGQVHACVLPDGREAVIKLQRPGIRQRMTTDLRIMHRLAKTVDRRTKLGRTANVVGVVEDLHANTFQELSPAVEAWRQQRFRDAIGAFGDNQGVTAPEVYWDYCGPHMICMERMSGVPMDEFDTIRERGANGELIMRRGVKAWMEAMMVHGPFHGDLHAGNLWVLDDGRVTFLDFGIMGELSEDWKGVAKALFRATMFGTDFSNLARAFKNVGAFPEDIATDEEMGQRLQMVIAPMLDQGLSEVSVGQVLKIFIDMMDQFSGGAGAPKEMLLLMKQLLYLERYSKELAPEWTIAKDLYLVKNIFPEQVAAKIDELGIALPD